MHQELPDDIAALKPADVRRFAGLVRDQLSRRIVGQEDVIEQVVTAFFSGGHVLLMGVPGLAKTLLIRSFSEALGMGFNRIQFTPDLMPSDVTGTDVISSKEGERGFSFLSGPIFANIVLADEINRTPPKTQSALLEAMEEFQVSASGRQFPLPIPFFVMSTQNPIEQEGTYTLPIAALDRFLFKVEVDYPEQDEELDMLFMTTALSEAGVEQVMQRDEVVGCLKAVREIDCPDPVVSYATKIVRATRPTQTEYEFTKELVEVGGSPRAVQALIMAGKARAALDGRGKVEPSDVRAVAAPSLRHRVIPSFHATADGISTDDLIAKVLESVPRLPGDEDPPEESRKGFNLWRLLIGDPKRKPRSVEV